MDTIYDLWLADRRIHRRVRAAQRGTLGPIAAVVAAAADASERRAFSIDPSA